MTSENIEDRLTELEKMLKLNPEKPEIVTENTIQTMEKSQVKSINNIHVKPSNNTQANSAKSGQNTTEQDILNILDNELTTLEILYAVNKHAICSQATIFRYLKKLTEQGKIKRIRRGRHVYYRTNQKSKISDIREEQSSSELSKSTSIS